MLGFTQTCFEGSMYLFVFLWVPFLQEAIPQSPGDLPLGYVFSSFMVSMTLGSVIYTSIVSLSRLDGAVPRATTSDSSTSDSVSSAALPPAIISHDRAITLHAKLSSAVCAASAAALLLSIVDEHEHTRFWAFCVFEACVGMYYPVQGMLRGRLIEDEHRATVRLPIRSWRHGCLRLTTA